MSAGKISLVQPTDTPDTMSPAAKRGRSSDRIKCNESATEQAHLKGPIQSSTRVKCDKSAAEKAHLNRHMQSSARIKCDDSAIGKAHVMGACPDVHPHKMRRISHWRANESQDHIIDQMIVGSPLLL